MGRLGEHFHTVLGKCVGVLKADEVSGAPYGAVAEQCSSQVVKTLYSTVENFVESLFRDACDVAATFKEEGREVYLSSFDPGASPAIPQAAHWDRSRTPSRGKSDMIVEEGHYVAKANARLTRNDLLAA